ncbi:hypothetical protein V6N11_027028 [Hibiscus sabdariffa]|uniref:Uncharacterized protein n=1 Tax=Hibiscus sabdariffa TaxID=183260 RepID=A0ABR2PG33_9ROSI
MLSGYCSLLPTTVINYCAALIRLVNPYGPEIFAEMSARRDPPAPEVPPIPRGQTTVTDPPPAPSIDVTTPVRGASAVGPQPVAGLFDENLGRQFLQLIQGAVRAANVDLRSLSPRHLSPAVSGLLRALLMELLLMLMTGCETPRDGWTS